MLSIMAALAFLVSEYQTGMTKQCIYDYAGSTYILTVESYKLCPLKIQI